MDHGHDITTVTVCKGRLHHLKQSLPRLVNHPFVENVVVDYGCPQGTRKWVAENFPQVNLVSVDSQGFNLSHARNLGAKGSQAPWLFFVDADVLIHPDAFKSLRKLQKPGSFFLANPVMLELCGAVLCQTSSFSAIGGYDEAITDWGGEDTDLYVRLSFHGVKQMSFPASLLSSIKHSDVERFASSAIKDRGTLLKINRIYTTAKLDLVRLYNKELPLTLRQHLLKEVTSGVLSLSANNAKTKNPVVRITIPESIRWPVPTRWAVKRELVYSL